MKYTIHTNSRKLLADTFTPVGIYLRLRDRFLNCLLLESSDYHSSENSFSIICAQPIATFRIQNRTIQELYPDGTVRETPISQREQLIERLNEFMRSFEVDPLYLVHPVGAIALGIFGYTAYEAVQYFESIHLQAYQPEEKRIPFMQYAFYKYVIVINHFSDEMFIYEHCWREHPSELEYLLSLIAQRGIAQYPFHTKGAETSHLSDEAYTKIVKQGKEECRKGNVFQVVLSREFRQPFTGDEFNVYRALRSINPSPYLFYFDYGDFRIFGSSPEAQLVIKNRQAQIHPIAGTFARTGDDETDNITAEKLKQDKKENSEHVMLVDLARNDLSRHCENVQVSVFAEIQFYSHVIHLVSRVCGNIRNSSAIEVFGDTFPAGTLSGAPKIKAMQIIDICEPDARGYYGGAIGYIGLNGNLNHAIIIRSFLSKNNCLFYRAGAGVVITSREENELQEVNNKLRALKQAIKRAEQL